MITVDARLLREHRTGTGRTVEEALPLFGPSTQMILDPSQRPLRSKYPLARFSGGDSSKVAAQGLMCRLPGKVMQFWMFGPLGRNEVLLGIYDLIPLRLGQIKRRLLLERLRLVRGRGNIFVFTLSEGTRASLVEEHGIPASRVLIARPGVDHLQLSRNSGIRSGLKPYALAIGRVSPHKGLSRLVDSWVKAGKPIELRLVLPRVESQLEIARRWRASGAVVVSDLTDEALGEIISAASLVCSPSEAEGFGLPLCEAAARGRPIIASDIGVYRELAIANVKWVDPLDVNAWVEAWRDYASVIDSEWRASLPTWHAWRNDLSVAMRAANLLPKNEL